MAKRLIVNADDFGYTEGVNRAIAECARDGILTSATLMATGPAFDHAVKRANGLGVGAHVVLVDGTCASDLRIIARDGMFVARSPVQLARMARSQEVAAEIECETAAQIIRIQQAGIVVSHVDTHKHTHMFPQVLRAVLNATKQCGVTRVRNPFEPRWALSLAHRVASRHRKRSVQVALLRTALHNRFLDEVRRSGMATTDGSIGVITTGTLDTALLVHMLDRVPEGIWELVCHPGYSDEALRGSQTRLTESREVERQALISPTVRSAADKNRIELVTFAQL